MIFKLYKYLKTNYLYFTKFQKNQNEKIQLIEHSEFFDSEFYLKKYPEVKYYKAGPAAHFLNIGWKIGFDPSLQFSTKKYYYNYVDIYSTETCPILHYELSGKKEDRKVYQTDFSRNFFTSKKNTNESRNQKKILLISHELSYTGAPLLLLNVADIFMSLGYGVIVASPKDGDLKKEFLEKGIDVCIDTELSYSNTSIEFYREKNVVFCIANSINSVVAYLNISKKIKSILWIHENIIPEKYNLYFSKKILSKINKKNNVYVPCELTKSYIESKIKEVKILRYPIKDHYTKTSTTSSLQNNDIIHFALLGTFEKRKGQDLVIEAVKRIPKDLRKKIDIVFIGDDFGSGYKTELIHNAKNVPELNFKKTIKNREEYYSLFENIDYLLCPSRQDPYPLVVIDALMMCRPPIISTNVGEKDILKHGFNGFIFKNENVEELKLIIEQILLKDVNYEEISKESRRVFEENFKVENIKNTFNQLINHVN